MEVIVGDGTKGLPVPRAIRPHLHSGSGAIRAGATEATAGRERKDAHTGRRALLPGADIGGDRREEKFIEKNLGGCVFVPLIGEFGYKD